MRAVNLLCNLLTSIVVTTGSRRWVSHSAVLWSAGTASYVQSRLFELVSKIYSAVSRIRDINHFNNQESENMDSQIDHAAGMPIGLLDELPPPVDATESLFSALHEPLAQEHPYRSRTE